MSKKGFLFSVLFFLITLNYAAFAQDNTSVKEEIIFVNPETAPKFSGGMDAFYTFFNKKFVMQNNFKGNNTAIATFVIEKDGSLSDIKVINNLGKNTNNESMFYGAWLYRSAHSYYCRQERRTNHRCGYQSRNSTANK